MSSKLKAKQELEEKRRQRKIKEKEERQKLIDTIETIEPIEEIEWERIWQYSEIGSPKDVIFNFETKIGEEIPEYKKEILEQCYIQRTKLIP